MSTYLLRRRRDVAPTQYCYGFRTRGSRLSRTNSQYLVPSSNSKDTEDRRISTRCLLRYLCVFRSVGLNMAAAVKAALLREIRGLYPVAPPEHWHQAARWLLAASFKRCEDLDSVELWTIDGWDSLQPAVRKCIRAIVASTTKDGDDRRAAHRHPDGVTSAQSAAGASQASRCDPVIQQAIDIVRTGIVVCWVVAKGREHQLPS